MRVLALILLAACSATTPAPAPLTNTETVGTLTKISSDYCPTMRVVGVWGSELFPGCPPPQFLSSLPLCSGATCGTPCAAHEGGFGGPMGRESHELAYTFSYDARGRLIAATLDGKPWASCTYDGDRLSGCDLGERALRVERDPSGRITKLHDDGETKTMRYQDGRLVAAGDNELTYDARGWVTKDGPDEVEHDDDGHVTRTTRGGATTTYRYESDRLAGINGADSFNATFEYDAQGRLIRIGRGGVETSSSTTYDYECE